MATEQQPSDDAINQMEGLKITDNPHKGKRCYNCLEPDHIAKMCPKKRIRRNKKRNYRLTKQVHSKCTFTTNYYYNGSGDDGKGTAK
ncbi:hypothetical protein M431DRAFT_510937 [Trichoderma harzianum CBS 226.95]|uniref:CCHC-type domain-containing protein n=1 Tax=Trichoderma harzianum CBS 226.95 TaxID=983964 RepID=A0A2T4A423_TRIHA|nr:hypothetical protein M431DRAFT_510937 [Trichoderma harzianum CBS 226.95]PTB51794.1 hypothetical protein M431DRAFT_510937 [Trichoderma harzianum CBS 226.95]